MPTLEFPPDFDWGCCADAYQTEDAWNEDGKGESIWDRFCHEGRVKTGETGDVACDFYHRYREDVALMKSLGLRTFRFSVAWTRILPEGKGRVEERGIDFYDRLVDELLAAGISPLACCYHFDLPQALQDEGGWANRATAHHFADYCGLIVERLGDRVKRWMVMNEPWMCSANAYLYGNAAPGVRDLDTGLRAMHVLALAHGMAVRAMRATAKPDSITTCYHTAGIYPASESEADRAAAERLWQWFNAWFIEATLHGRYPDLGLPDVDVEKLLGVEQGDMETVRAPLDYLGINVYQRLVAADDARVPFLRVLPVIPEEGEFTDYPWEVWPEAVHQVFSRMWRDYRMPMWMTEVGCAYADFPDEHGVVDDARRISFLRRYFAQLHRAMDEGADVRGCHVWSLMDNFEWQEGFRLRFGLVYCDHQTQRRIVKRSGGWYRDLIASGRLELP